VTCEQVKLDDHEEPPCIDVFHGRFPKLKPYYIDPRSAEENMYLQLKIASEAVSIIMMGCASLCIMLSHTPLAIILL
jgi:hypothetical protein